MESRLFDSGYPMKIGGQEYTASALTDLDYGDLDNFIKSTYVNIAVAAGDELPSDKKKELISIALNNSLEIGWDTPEGDKILYSGRGMIRLGYQMIRKRHPTVTFKEFREHASKDVGASIQAIEIAYTTLTRILLQDLGGDPSDTVKSKAS